MAKVSSNRIAGEKGQAIIELALTLPLLLLVVMGIFDFGFMFQKYEVVTNAAREGARVGVLPGYTMQDAEQRALTYLDAGGLGGPGVTTVTCTSGRAVTKDSRCAIAQTMNVNLPPPPGGTTGKTVPAVQVTVEYDYEFVFVGPIVNLFGGNLATTRLRAVSVMREEPD